MFLILERVRVSRGRPGVLDTWCNARRALQSLFKRGYTLLVVLLGWVLFRADNLTYAVDYIRAMFGLIPDAVPYFGITYYLTPYNLFIMSVAVILSANYVQQGAITLKRRCRFCGDIGERVLLVVLIVVCVVTVMAQTYNPFIYFRF